MRQPQPNTGQVPIAVIVNPAPARQTQAPLAAQPGPGQQGMSRLQETLGGVPPATLFFLALNIGIFIGAGLWTFNLGSVSISSYYVLYKLELYRMISAAFFHMGLLHIGMNMMSLFFMGPHLERTYGTVQFFIITWVFVILDGVLYVAISAGLAFVVFRDMKWLVESAVGFSGVLFSMAVLESSSSGGATRSLFGMVSVPTKYYPWAMLIAMQIMMPTVSFMGHLSGLLLGIAFTKRGLNWIIPSRALIEDVQNLACFSRVRAMQSFVPASDSSFTWRGSAASEPATGTSIV